MRNSWIIFVLICYACFSCQTKTKTLLQSVFETQPIWFDSIIQDQKNYQVQVLYTQINRDDEGHPFFASYSHGLNNSQYFYPASTIKLPVVLLALERLNELNIEGLDMHTTMLTDSLYDWQSPAQEDSSARSGKPSVAHYIKKILLVSDNDAYNRLYEFLGYDYINQKLAEKGYSNTRIVHRLGQNLSKKQNKITNQIRFIKDGQELYRQAEQMGTGNYRSEQAILLGKGEMHGGVLLEQAKNFQDKNQCSLKDMQAMLKALLFPAASPYYNRFNLTATQLAYVKRWMSTLPRESEYPTYDTEQYFDSYVKFFMFGDSRDSIPSSIRIFNKVGDAYGFLIDNAYIVDKEHNVEFLLSACINVNRNGIYNDDVYEYEQLGFPFMAQLGKAIYKFEKQRQK